MPKFDMILNPGDPIPEEFAAILSNRLSPKLREKLLRHGGLIRVSVSSPYVERGKQSELPKLVVDDVFVRQLADKSGDTEATRGLLQRLTVKQLNDVCERLRLPMRVKASGREVREEILKRVQSGMVWDRIAGKKSVQWKPLPPLDTSGTTEP